MKHRRGQGLRQRSLPVASPTSLGRKRALVAHKPDEGGREPVEPTTPVPTPLADRTTAKVSGAAALWLLNDEADDWQRATAPELRGHYLTTIDYVTANMSRWKTTAELQPKIEAAAHAYRGRSLMVYATWSFVFLVGPWAWQARLF